MSSEKIYVFKIFERIWHWSQASLIIFMLITGFEVHGSYTLFGFAKAVSSAHHCRLDAGSVVGVRHFLAYHHRRVETVHSDHGQGGGDDQALFGRDLQRCAASFQGDPLKKHNPLQRLAYIGVLLFIGPLLWLTGWFYLFYGVWQAWGVDKFVSLEWVAFFHTAGAFMMLAFLIAHVYLTTAGHTPTSHIKAMITGWEEV